MSIDFFSDNEPLVGVKRHWWCCVICSCRNTYLIISYLIFYSRISKENVGGYKEYNRPG